MGRSCGGSRTARLDLSRGPHEPTTRVMSSSDRVELYRALKRCSPAQFGEVLLILHVDASYLPPASAEVAARAQALIHLVEQHPHGLASLRAALREAAPALLDPQPRAYAPLGRAAHVAREVRSGPSPIRVAVALGGAVAVCGLVLAVVIPKLRADSGGVEPEASPPEAVLVEQPGVSADEQVRAPDDNGAEAESRDDQDRAQQILVWSMTSGNLPVGAGSKPRYRTSLLSGDGKTLGSVEGLYAMSGRTVWRWVAEERPLYANDCGEMFGEGPRRHKLTQQVAWFEEVDGERRIEVVAPQSDDMTADFWDQSTMVLGSVGPRFFVATQFSGYFCGANGDSIAELKIVDLTSGSVIADPVSNQEKQSVAALYRSKVAAKFDDVDELNGWRDSPLTITAYMTRWTPAGFRMMANVSASTCAACGDGEWGEGWVSARVDLDEPLGPYRAGIAPPITISADPSGSTSVTAGWTHADSQRLMESVFR